MSVRRPLDRAINHAVSVRQLVLVDSSFARSSTTAVLHRSRHRSQSISSSCRQQPYYPPASKQSPRSFLQRRYSCFAVHQRRRASTASSGSETPLARTPYYDLHVKHGAKFSPFAGFEMPLYYSDLSHAESHHWVREKCAIFDVSHMVQNTLNGPGAEAFLMQVTPTAINELSENQSTLSCLLDPSTGGIVDDTVITRLGPDSFYFVTNAGCRDSDAAYLKAELKKFSKSDSRGLNWSTLDDYGLIALQGPLAASTLQKYVPDTDLSTLYFGHCRSVPFVLSSGTKTPPLLISRTGYTGEDGFEISIPVDPSDASAPTDLPILVAETLLTDASTVRLAGLAARDSLRLEAGMCLYGHDISLSTTPPEAGLSWLVSKSRRSPSAASAFNGADRILSQLASPKTMGRRRVGLVIEKGAPAREGAEIVAAADPEGNNKQEEKVVGLVTSGLPSPSLAGKNIAMALVDNGFHKKGTKLHVKVRKNIRPAEVVGMPFVESKFYRG